MKAETSRFLIAAMALLLSSGVALADTMKEKGAMTEKQAMEKQTMEKPDDTSMKEEKGLGKVGKKMKKEKSMDGERTMEKGEQKDMK